MLLYTARWVLPVASPPIADGAVGVEGGRIAYVGARADAPRAKDTVALGDAYLLPGLVNAHTHLELSVMRGYLEDGPFRSWLLRLTKARGAVLDDAALNASARRGIAEGLLSGITTYADTSSSTTVVTALKRMRVRGISYQEVFGPDPAQCDESMAELRDRLNQLTPRTSSLVRLGVSPHAPFTVSDDLYRAVAKFAADASLPVAVHIAESREEARFVVVGAGPFADGWRGRGIPVAPRAASPVRLLEATGVLATRPLLIHCVQVDRDDIRTIARFRSPVVHSPASNAKLGHGVAPLDDLLDAGIDVGLGTDSVASNNRMDLLDEARLAVLLARGGNESSALKAHRALELATVGGARGLGLESEIGTLEVGKAADLAAFRVDSLRDEPIYDVAAALLFGAAGRRALMVCVDGVVLVRDGILSASIEREVDGEASVFRAAAERLTALAEKGEGEGEGEGEGNRSQD